MATTPASSGSLRQKEAASGNPSGAASATMKYDPRGSDTVKPAVLRPAESRSRFLARTAAVARKYSSGRSRPTAMAGWNGAPFT